MHQTCVVAFLRVTVVPGRYGTAVATSDTSQNTQAR